MFVKIDLMKEVASLCIQRLRDAGFTTSFSDNEEVIYSYVKVYHRRIRSQPRSVHKAAYNVAEHLVEGEKELIGKVLSGDDLWPHQSRKILEIGPEDGMLNDYGIQHFHLGTSSDPRYPNLVRGTKDLLFAIVTDTDFYAIGIYDHNAWTERTVVDLVHKTWPHLTEPYTLKGSPEIPIVEVSRVYSDEELKKLRALGANILQQRPDGSVQVGMGGGIAGDGSSVWVRRETDKLLLHIEGLEKAVRDTIISQTNSRRCLEPVTVTLKQEQDFIYAFASPVGILINLSNKLNIPLI